ncbi:MAG: 4Fe-4S binding protein [Burkholderiales bacterium]
MNHRHSSEGGNTRWLAKVGTAMRYHQGMIFTVQWIVVVFYLLLLVIPAFMPLPPEDAHYYNNLRLFAQFLFWGVWWPFVILSIMLFGRLWCGVFCPEGALTEFASRCGLARAVPRWMRWSGWPLTVFTYSTVYAQLIGAYAYPNATLLLLGGSTAAAITVGFLYGKEKRVWCRYLCLGNGVFSLLARIAPIHFRVSEEAWKRDTIRQPMVNCAPLIDIRHMKSASACHACGRCSDFKGAVSLAGRSPASEILNSNNRDVKVEDALMLIFGAIGIATAALQWSTNSRFIQIRSAITTWLVSHHSFLLLQDDAPWWLLKHYPDAHDAFTWLDGLCILIFILGGGFALGFAVLVAVWAAARLADDSALSWQRLTLSLVPIAGIGIFLGLSMMTFSDLKAERILLEWVPATRIIFLLTGSGFSAYLGWKLIVNRLSARHLFAFSVSLLPIVLINAIWITTFFS